MEEEKNENNIPVPDFEYNLRSLTFDVMEDLPQFEEFLKDKSAFMRAFLAQEGGLMNYIGQIVPEPESWDFLQNFYMYYLLWYYRASPTGLGSIMGLLDQVYKKVEQGVSVDFAPVIDELKLIDESIKKASDRAHNDIKGPIIGLESVIITSFTAQTTALLTPLGSIAGELVAVSALLTSIEATLGTIATAVETELPAIKEAITALPGEIAEALRERDAELASAVAKEVNKTIIGESYFKWSSTNQFYPTMVFVFVERDVVQYPRRSQIKVRIPLSPEEVTPAIIALYKERIEALIDFSYEYGLIRCNYVAVNKRYKTTIFTINRAEAINVLTTISNVIGEAFEPDLLSVTEGRRRPALARRQEPIGDNPAEIQDYNENFKVYLVRATLLVGGVKYPIEVF